MTLTGARKGRYLDEHDATQLLPRVTVNANPFNLSLSSGERSRETRYGR